MNKIRYLFAFLFYCFGLYAQGLRLDTSYTPAYLVDKILVGNGIRVSNIKMTGLKESLAYFSIDTNVLGMKHGIMLSTGNVFEAAHANISPGTSGGYDGYYKNTKYKGDKDLNALCGDMTYDNVILEFDFVPYHNAVSFNFLFASEEYPEYVGSEFNDVFAFILTGKTIRKQNLALAPDTEDPITVNNINHKKNKELFINNNYFINYSKKKNGVPVSGITAFRQAVSKMFVKKYNEEGIYYSPGEKKKLDQYLVNNFEFDGFTTLLKAACILQPWKMYHLKIAIGDAADGIFDSAVMLEGGSFSSANDSTAHNYKPYPDLSSTMNWDSIFGIKKIKPIVWPPIDPQFKLTNINFETDKYDIPDTSKAKLDLLASYLGKHENYNLSIHGHTDSIGGQKHNLLLSENRAMAIMNFLMSKGIEKSRLQYAGNSFYNPVADNSFEKGRLLNRRVELTVIDGNKK